MRRDKQPFRRRTVLKTIGGTTVGLSVGTGAAAARGRGNGGPDNDEDLIDVDPEELELEGDETGEVTVEIEGPPFGRTDVEVDGVEADPAEFRLEGRGDSQEVELGPVDGDATATFKAELPRGDEQEVEIEIEFTPAFDEVVEEGDSIQEAIDDAEEGDTIRVESGTYEEALTIDVDGLTLESAEEHAATIKNDELAGGGESLVTVDANDATIEGFTVEVFPADGQTPGGIGLNGDGSEAINNIVSDESDGNRLIAGSGDEITVSGNEIKDGAIGYSGTGSATFTDNTVVGSIADGEAFWTGWPDMFEGDLTIEDNDFTGVDYDSPVEDTVKLTVVESLQSAGASVNGESADGEDEEDVEPVADAVEEANDGVQSVVFDAEDVTIDY